MCMHTYYFYRNPFQIALKLTTRRCLEQLIAASCLCIMGFNEPIPTDKDSSLPRTPHHGKYEVIKAEKGSILHQHSNMARSTWIP